MKKGDHLMTSQRRALPRHGPVFWWVVFLAGGFVVYCFGVVVIVLLARAGVLP